MTAQHGLAPFRQVYSYAIIEGPGAEVDRACMRGASRARESEDAVANEDNKQAAHRALVDRVLHGAGQVPAELRARAFTNADLPSPLQALIGKVATSPTEVTDADFAAAMASGFTEDQLFELVVAAAVGQSARRYDAGLAALAEATAPGRPDDAA